MCEYDMARGSLRLQGVCMAAEFHLRGNVGFWRACTVRRLICGLNSCLPFLASIHPCYTGATLAVTD